MDERLIAFGGRLFPRWMRARDERREMDEARAYRIVAARWRRFGLVPPQPSKGESPR